MIELKGSLKGAGLLPIVQLLADMQETGELRVARGGLTGELGFDGGRLVAVTFAEERGLAALAALALAFPEAEFTYAKAPPPTERNVDLTLDQLRAHLSPPGGGEAASAVPSLRAVPRLLGTGSGGHERLELDRSALQTLLAVDGQRTVAEIVGERPLVPTLRELGELVKLGLIRIELPGGAPAERGDRPRAVATPAPRAEEVAVGPRVVPPTRPVTAPAEARPGRPPLPARPITPGARRPLPGLAAAHESAAPAAAAAASSCPKLAFADDPERHYSRPTGLHRCYASGSPGLVTPQEQRELCLTGGYAACARWQGLNDATTSAPAAATTSAPTAAAVESRVVTLSGAPGRPPTTRAAVVSTPPPETPAEVVAHSAARLPDRKVMLAGAAAVLLVAVLVAGWLLFLRSDAAPTAEIASAPPRPAVAPTAAPQALQAAPNASPRATRAPAPTPAIGGPALVDTRFTDPQPGWPQNPPLATWADGAYRVTSRQNRFAALAAPLDGAPDDVIVSATLRKVGGPPGGGYGVIVRDQGPGPRDGLNQAGRYYVFEVSDRGEVGAWRRDGDQFVDLVSWTPSAVVRQGGSPNDLLVRAIGDLLAFTVNGTEVLNTSDTTLSGGGVGLFVGGDANAVALDHFSVQVPD